MVGDRHGGLAVGGRSGNGLVESRRAVEHRILGVDMQMSERIRHLGSPPGRPVTLPVDTDVDALWTSYTGVISNLTGESLSHKRGVLENSEIGARTGLGRLTTRLLSPAATDLAPQAL